MSKAPKTRPTGQAVTDFLDGVEPAKRKEDGYRLLEMMTEETGDEATMWGPSIIGFGTYTQTYADGHTDEWLAAGFSPRKAKLSVYIMAGFEGHEALMAKLGKYKTGKSCLYINKLEDVDESVLREIIRKSSAEVKAKGRGPGS